MPIKVAYKGPRRNEFVVSTETNDYTQMDPKAAAIWSEMGGKEKDRKIAEQAAKLFLKLPKATTPELITYLWLQKQGIPFDYQVVAQGGRSKTGGSVVDFLVRPGKVWAWRIQGHYFHGAAEKRARDDIARRLLVGAYALGYQIDGVVDIWDYAIYQDRETVFTLAMVGVQIELGN